jgi:hypothetical protein
MLNCQSYFDVWTISFELNIELMVVCNTCNDEDLCVINNTHLVNITTFFLQVPKSLTKPGGYDHREALFGIPPYGGTIAQSLYYADDNDLCDAANIDTRTGYPIRAKVFVQ